MAIYSTIQQQNAVNMKYKKKLKKLKKFVENLVFVSILFTNLLGQRWIDLEILSNFRKTLLYVIKYLRYRKTL